MTGHQPFPIAAFTEGLQLAKEPWLSPVNAFREMDDARIFRGQVEKRNGFSRFAEITKAAADVSNLGSGVFSGYSLYYHSADLTARIIPESILIRSDNGSAGAPYINATLDPTSEQWIPADTYTNPGRGDQNESWRWNMVEEGTGTVIGYAVFRDVGLIDGGVPVLNRFEIGVVWSSHSGYTDLPTDNGEIFARETIEDEEIVGMFRFQKGPSTYSLAATPTTIGLYNPSGNSGGFYSPQGHASAVPPNTFEGPFTGTATDYFWFWPLDNYVVLTNGVDPVCLWDPALTTADSIVEMDTDWTTPGTNELDHCQLVLRFGGRLLYLNTTEGATNYPGRVRWTTAGSFQSWDGPLAFSDAPSELGEIVTAQFIGDRLFVGFETGWMELQATGDANLPLTWHPFISRFGAVSKLSTIKDNERLLSRSDTTMQALDPNGQYYIDEAIPDLVQGYNPGLTDLCTSIRNEGQRAFWWTVTKGIDTRPNNVLCATYDEQNQLSWSQYNVSFNVFAEFDSQQTPSWNSLGPATWNDYSSLSWNDARAGVAGFTQIIAGGTKGIVYRFGLSNKDSNAYTGESSIEMNIATQRLAPFPGQHAHLGWIDLYADAASGASLTLSFLRDTDSGVYQSTQVDLSPSGSGSKVYRRIRVGMTAAFHSFRVESSSDRNVSIDALVPYFRPAGRIRAFN